MTDAIATVERTAFEQLLLSLPKGTHIGSDHYGRGFQAFGHPESDPYGDACWGKGETLEATIADYLNAIDLHDKRPTLKTARQVKEAVMGLIAEHDAAPASFRAAVDDLRVADR